MKKSIILILALFLSFLLFAQEETQPEEAAPQQEAHAAQAPQAQPEPQPVAVKTAVPVKAQSVNSVFTGSRENESLVKLEIEYKLLDNTPQKKIEYAAIVSNNVVEGTPEYKTIAEHRDESTIGNYLMITGLEAILPNQKEQKDSKLAAVDLDSFNPESQDYKVTAIFPNGERKEYKHSDLLLADNGVAFINFKEDPELFPVMLNGESARDVTLNRTLYIKNFGKTYEVTPLFINFSLRSSGTMEYYLQKNRSFIARFFNTTAVAHITIGNLIMMLVAFIFIFLAIAKDYEPLLLLPIGFGILIGNIPTAAGVQIGVYDPGSVLNYLYFGVLKGIYPPLIFLGIGAMTDFSYMIANPKLILIGGGAQVGIFAAFLIAIFLGFNIQEAASIGIIGGADGPTAIFTTGLMAPHLLGAVAIAAYSYMALVPVIQPPIVKLLTTKKERLIRMKPPRVVSKRERVLFPIVAFIVCTFIAPGGLPLIGMLLLGNIIKESGVTDRLSKTASNALIDIVTVLIGITVGASTSAQTFLTPASVKIFLLGALSFMISTAGGVLIAKLINCFLKPGNKLNPIIGCAGVSAVPDSARVAQNIGKQADPTNYLLMHAMAPNVAGVIGSAIAAGILLGIIPH
jgi:oxaloacetate decarboxylase beta subunit